MKNILYRNVGTLGEGTHKKYKNKIVAIWLSLSMITSLSACTNTADSVQETIVSTDASKEVEQITTTEGVVQSEVHSFEAMEEQTTESEETDISDNNEEENPKDFSVQDISTQQIKSSVYAKYDDLKEMVLTIYTMDDGRNGCVLITIGRNGEGDIAYGACTGDSEEDENSVTWTYLSFKDGNTGQTIEIGVGEKDGTCYILGNDGYKYEGRYLTSKEAVEYMQTANEMLEQ